MPVGAPAAARPLLELLPRLQQQKPDVHWGAVSHSGSDDGDLQLPVFQPNAHKVRVQHAEYCGPGEIQVRLVEQVDGLVYGLLAQLGGERVLVEVVVGIV